MQEKPLSVALREINAGLLTFEDIDAEGRGRSAARRRRFRRGLIRSQVHRRRGRYPARRPRVVLGVTGGIAAYKACELLRRLTESGHDVPVVPTAAALQFVGAATWAALSGQPVATDVWTDVARRRARRLGQEADLVVVAPATADLLARAATGAPTTC